MTKEVKYYSIGEREIPYATDPEEAVREFIDGLLGGEEVPEFVEVQGYALMSIRDSVFDCCLESLLENLDEEYGDPFSFSNYVLSDKAEELFKAFKEQIQKEYPVWLCEEVGEAVQYQVKDIIDEN